MPHNPSHTQRRRNRHQAGAAATPHLRHQQQQRRQQQQTEPRARCTNCLVEYPLTRRFFLRVDCKRDADRRTCLPCRTGAIVDETELRLLRDEHQEDHGDDVILPEDLADDERLHRDFEDLGAEERRSKLHASRQFGGLVIKHLSATKLAESRLRFRRRVRPASELMLEREILRFRWLADHLPLMSQDDRLKREQRLVQIRPVNIADMQLEPDLLPHAQFLLSLDLSDTSHSDNIDDELERATELLALMRLPERDAIEQAQLIRERQLVSTHNRNHLRHQRQVAHQLAQQDGDQLAQIFQRGLALTDDDDRRSSEPAKAPPTFTAVANLTAVKAELAATATSLPPATSVSARTGADSPPTPSPSPRATKRPRNQRETPVDPRLEMFERRRQLLRLHNESTQTPKPA